MLALRISHLLSPQQSAPLAPFLRRLVVLPSLFYVSASTSPPGFPDFPGTLLLPSHAHTGWFVCLFLGFRAGTVVKDLPDKQKSWVRSLGQEDPLEKEMTTHSRILAWEIPRTEEPGGLQPMGSQKSQTRLSDSVAAVAAYSSSALSSVLYPQHLAQRETERERETWSRGWQAAGGTRASCRACTSSADQKPLSQTPGGEREGSGPHVPQLQQLAEKPLL